MTNDEYFNELALRMESLAEIRKKGKNIAAGMIGQTLFKEDLFFCASADRNMNLSDGFFEMLKTRNLTCAGALLRLQMDNCMRTYAAFIAGNKDRVIDCLISGKHINSEKDKNGNRLSDTFLKEELSKIDPVFKQVYEQASGYIHLSSKAFYQTVVKCEDNTIELQVGRELPEKRNTVLLQAADAFIHFTELHYRMLEAVTESKTQYDAAYEDE